MICNKCKSLAQHCFSFLLSDSTLLLIRLRFSLESFSFRFQRFPLRLPSSASKRRATVNGTASSSFHWFRTSSAPGEAHKRSHRAEKKERTAQQHTFSTSQLTRSYILRSMSSSNSSQNKSGGRGGGAGSSGGSSSSSSGGHGAASMRTRHAVAKQQIKPEAEASRLILDQQLAAAAASSHTTAAAAGGTHSLGLGQPLGQMVTPPKSPLEEDRASSSAESDMHSSASQHGVDQSVRIAELEQRVSELMATVQLQQHRGAQPQQQLVQSQHQQQWLRAAARRPRSLKTTWRGYGQRRAD